MRRSFTRLTIVLAALLAASPALAQGHPIGDRMIDLPIASDFGASTAPFAGNEATGSYFTRVLTGRDNWTSLPLGIAALVIVLVVTFRTVRNLFRRRGAETTGQQD